MYLMMGTMERADLGLGPTSLILLSWMSRVSCVITLIKPHPTILQLIKMETKKVNKCSETVSVIITFLLSHGSG